MPFLLAIAFACSFPPLDEFTECVFLYVYMCWQPSTVFLYTWSARNLFTVQSTLHHLSIHTNTLHGTSARSNKSTHYNTNRHGQRSHQANTHSNYTRARAPFSRSGTKVFERDAPYTRISQFTRNIFRFNFLFIFCCFRRFEIFTFTIHSHSSLFSLSSSTWIWSLFLSIHALLFPSNVVFPFRSGIRSDLSSVRYLLLERIVRCIGADAQSHSTQVGNGRCVTFMCAIWICIWYLILPLCSDRMSMMLLPFRKWANSSRICICIRSIEICTCSTIFHLSHRYCVCSSIYVSTSTKLLRWTKFLLLHFHNMISHLVYICIINRYKWSF